MPCNPTVLGLALALTPVFLQASDFAVPGDWALQDALNAAQGGDTITIDASTPIMGNFVLPATAGPLPITIRTSSYDQLPNRRILPGDTDLLAKIITPNSFPALRAASGANGWRLLGLEIISAAYAFEVIQLGEATETSVDDLPGDIDIDRLYVHASPAYGSKRGIELNSRSTTIRNSYISGFWSDQQDSQAIAGWNGPGPFDILNNYLEGGGENLIFGGATASVPNVVPSDIRVVGNYFTKPASWFGTPKIVKNLLELKNAQRVLVDGNIIENNWTGGQSGYALLFTVRTENGDMPWAVVKDVTIQNNIVRRSSGGFEVAGFDSTTGQGSSGDFRFLNNYFDIGNVPTGWGITNRFLLIVDGVKNITLNHNTVFHTGDAGIGGVDGQLSAGFVFSNNIVPHNLYGIINSLGGIGVPGLDKIVPGYQMNNNVIVATPNPKAYVSGPTNNGTAQGNFFPADWSGLRFQNLAAGEYQLAQDSPYRGAGTDSKDVGVDKRALDDATRYSVAGDRPPLPDNTYSVSNTSSPVVLTGETFSGTWTLASRGHLSDWVGLFDANSTDASNPLFRLRTNGAAKGTFSLPVSRQTGTFELRYVTFQGDTMASVPVIFANRVTATLMVIKSDAIHVNFQVISGSVNSSDVIALIAPDDTIVDSRPVSGTQGSVSFQLPSVPGPYAVKYLIGGLRPVASTNVPIP